MKLVRWLLIGILSLSFDSFATTIIERDLDQLAEYADVSVIVEVISGTIIQTNGDDCGVAYTGKVIHVIKGSEEISETEIKFGRHTGISIGDTYLLFLNYYETSEEYKARVLQLSSFVDSDNLNAYVECKCLIPGFIMLGDGVFPFEHNIVKLPEPNGEFQAMSADQVLNRLTRIDDEH